MKTNSNTMPALTTYEDYCQIPVDGNRYEVIDGVLHMSPSPAPRHQRISVKLSFLLMSWELKTKKGKIWTAPIDILLSDHDVVQPDIVFISSERLSIVKDKNIQGPPDLVVEILSPSNHHYDEITKKNMYATFGVSEYWVVDPVAEEIQVYLLQNEDFVAGPLLSREAGDRLSSEVLLGFECSLDEVFEK